RECPRNISLLPAARPGNVWAARCARISTALSTRCWLITLMLALCTKSRVLASMRFKARAMNAYLYASNLGHIPEQLAWATAKRGMAAHLVKAAYSSQECSRCHYVDRANRPDQKTFCCVVCG